MITANERKLRGVIEETVALLHRVGESSWAVRLSELLREAGTVDSRSLLAYYGGMGSLNDLILSSTNGHRVTSADKREVNRELRRLAHEMWALAHEIERSSD